MKVLYIDQTGQLGGGEIALLPWLREARHNAHVLLFDDGPFRTVLEESGVDVSILLLDKLKTVRRESGARAILSTLPAFASLRKRLAVLAAGFDVLYANSQKAFLLAALAKGRNQPLVWHLRDILTAEHFSRPLRMLAVLAGNRYASVIVANSNATAEAFVAAGGRRDKVRVVYDAVSSEPFDAVATEQLAALRSELGVSEQQALVGVFGRLTPWKGQHIFLEAMSGIPNAHGVIVGDALFGEEEYAAGLRERSARPDLRGRIHFLGFRRDVVPLMKCMHVIAHTSTSPEPFGLVIVEGMLAGKPVIATRAGGAMEIIVDGESGVLTTPGSAHSLREAIVALLGDAEYAARLARAGRKRAEEVFCPSALFQRLSAILSRLRTGSTNSFS